MAFETTHILITKLKLIASHESMFPGLKVNNSIEALEHLQNILESAENYQGSNKTVDDKWDKLLERIYSLEDDIETLLSTTMLPSHRFWRKKHTSTRILGEESLSDNIKKLIEGINDYCKQIQPTLSSDSGVPAVVPVPPTKSLTDSEDLQVSTDNETVTPNAAMIVLTDLVEKLSQQVLSRLTSQYLILTVDGAYRGNAILLWTVYSADGIKRHFKCRAWVRVSEELGQREILLDILKQVTGKEEDRLLLKSPQRRLHDFLVSKRYLIVLYGVQTTEFLDNIKAAFPYSLNGSRVITVVQSGDVAMQINSWINGRRHLSNSRKQKGQLSDGWPQSSTYLEEEYGITGVKADIDKLTINRRHHLSNSRKQKGQLSDGWPQSSTYLEEEYGITGVKADIDKLTQSILNPRILLFLISIKGTVGSGRTTLLWPIYNAKDVRQHFQCRAWVHVPEEFHEEVILTSIFEQVASVELKQKLPVVLLRERLHNFLAQKRYLVVLCDVWMSKIWDNLKLSLPNSLNGSRVILVLSEGEANEVQNTNSLISGMIPVRKLPDLKDVQEDFSDQKGAERRDRLSDVKDEESSIVGLDDKVKELAELTLNSYKLHFLVSVLGEAGSGKTALVRTVYNSVACKQHFRCRAWVNVPMKLDEFNERQLLTDLLGQLRNVKQKESLALEQLRERLHLFLTWKRYLIVLDDVPTPDAWEKLNRVFPNLSNGSRVIITTRKAYLAYHINPETVVLQLRRLTDYESWELFLRKVQTAKKMQIDTSDSQLISLKEKILQRSRGLPLPIVLLGGLLYMKDKYDEWPSVIDRPIPKMEKKKNVSTEDQMNPSGKSASSDAKRRNEKKVMVVDPKTASTDQIDFPNQPASSATKQKGRERKLTSSDKMPLSDIMALAYQDLSPALKCCLLYLGLFPKSYEIPLRRLYQLWLAEGFVIPTDKVEAPLEKLVEEYFEELQSRSMIEVTKLKIDGSPKACRVPNTIYDTLFVDTEKVGFFHISRSPGTRGSPWFIIRRLSEMSDTSLQSEQMENRVKLVRSYISFYGKRGDAPTNGVKELLSKVVGKGSGMLTVLDLEGVYKPVLSDILGKLPFLKYLGLRRTLLDDVPQSVGDLSHLETLDIKHTFITKLPGTIWKAKKLQNLYTSDIDVDMSTLKPSACASLNNLKILWGLSIKKGSPPRKWMTSLVGLRKLKLTCDEASYEVIVSWIAQLDKLQSLHLRLIDKFNQPLDLRVEELREWKKTSLSQLYLLGKLPKQIATDDLPKNLEILTLSMTHLSEDPMDALGQLKQLKVLRLYAQSFLGPNMTCTPGGFPQLRVLKLWMLYKLNNWTVQQGAMPMLRELEIRCCKNLKMPDGLVNLSALKELTLTNMKDDFVADAERNMGGKVAIMKHFYFSSSWE
ncbi:hypothetical protein PTKIN_Ptkin01aG0330400 [Pterospermum kingtungense]